MPNKVSIRLFEDREVRAIWSDEETKWFFSVLDIVGTLNRQDDYEKNRNYWKYLKTKLRKENNEVVSLATQLKLLAPEEKCRLTIHALIASALPSLISDREMFMKGIDYSYFTRNRKLMIL